MKNKKANLNGRQSRYRSERGQSLVEFIFIFLIFFALFLAILHIGFMTISKTLLNMATYSACREYIVTQDRRKAQQAAQYYIDPVLKQGFIKTYDTYFSGDNGFGSKAIVILKATYSFLGLPGIEVQKIFPMESHCVMTME
jgi:hypothetical protein